MIRKLRLFTPFALLIFAIACGTESPQETCQIEDSDDGQTTLRCPDGSEFTIQDGDDGEDGEDGTSCTVQDNEDGTATISCEDGSSVTISNDDDDFDCFWYFNGDGTATIECTGLNPMTVDIIEGVDLAVLDAHVLDGQDDEWLFLSVTRNLGHLEAYDVEVHYYFDSDEEPDGPGDEIFTYDMVLPGELLEENFELPTMSSGTYNAWIVVEADDDVDLSNNVYGPIEYTVD